MDSLSDRDKAVLRSILDTTGTIGDVADAGDRYEEEHEGSPTEAHRRSQELCVRGVQAAEAGQLQAASALLDEAVTVAPDRAAAYSDRAQLRRLMLKDTEAMADIEQALKLTAGKKGRARAQALCQKGVLLRKLGSDDEARTAFAKAADLGSGFARKQVVELNPYAALCNQMLSKVMKEETCNMKL